MKYSSSLPEKNDNISNTHPLKEFALLSGGLALVLCTVYLLLGFFVDLVVEHISFETESALFRSLDFGYDLSNDTNEKEEKTVQSLVDNLQQCTDIPYPIKVHIVETDTPNAIALPGGHIAVFSGLLDAVQMQNGLAFVMAHELGHFNNRDHLRGLGRSLVLYTLSALLTGGDSSLSNMLAPSVNLSTATYSQQRESLADQFAVDILYCHSGTMKGATTFFDYLLEKKPESDLKLFHYFSSHPQTQERITAINEYGKQQGYIQ